MGKLAKGFKEVLSRISFQAIPAGERSQTRWKVERSGNHIYVRCFVTYAVGDRARLLETMLCFVLKERGRRRTREFEAQLADFVPAVANSAAAAIQKRRD